MGDTKAVSDHIPDHAIVRDQSFRSYYGDLALALRSPRNIDLAILKVESLFEGCKVDVGEELPTSYSTAPSVREVCRVTLSSSAATRLAMDILDEVAELDLLDEDGTRNKFDEILSAIRAAGEDRSE